MSPFLILLHLYTLGASFLLRLQSAIVFLIFSIFILIANVLLSQNALQLLRDDPGTTILYVISFVAIIPLSQFLTSSYHFKDTLSRLLREYIQLGERREESILESLDELVFVVDHNLNIVSTSASAEKTLGLPKSNIIGYPLFDILNLQNEAGIRLKNEDLVIDDILKDKTARIVNNYYLHTKVKSQPEKIVINMRPVTDSQGRINQIVFIITDTFRAGFLEKHSNIEQAQAKHQELINAVKETLIKTHQGKTETNIELLDKIEDDVLTALEIEDHPIQKKVDFEDIAWICQQVADKKQEFASSCGVNLVFHLPENETSELAALRLRSTNASPQSLLVSDFSVLTDKRWLEIAVKELLDIAILIASGMEKREIELSVSRFSTTALNITITTFAPLFSQPEQQQLFVEYYGELGKKTNLKNGSGLEGFIVKSVINQLNIPLEIKSWGQPSRLQLTLTLSKLPH